MANTVMDEADFRINQSLLRKRRSSLQGTLLLRMMIFRNLIDELAVMLLHSVRIGLLIITLWVMFRAIHVDRFFGCNLSVLLSSLSKLVKIHLHEDTQTSWSSGFSASAGSSSSKPSQATTCREERIASNSNWIPMLTYTLLYLYISQAPATSSARRSIVLHIYQIFCQSGDLQSRSVTPRLICRLQPVVFPDGPRLTILYKAPLTRLRHA